MIHSMCRVRWRERIARTHVAVTRHFNHEAVTKGE